MIELHCPNCGRRNVSEFRYVGERHIRPDPDVADPTTWRSYLYLRDNPAGWTDETWLHRAGCRRYLVVERHTVSNEIRSIREAMPVVASEADAPHAQPGRAQSGGSGESA